MIDGRVYRLIQHGRTWSIEFRLSRFVREVYRGLDRELAERFMNDLKRAGWSVEDQHD